MVSVRNEKIRLGNNFSPGTQFGISFRVPMARLSGQAVAKFEGHWGRTASRRPA